MTDSDERLLTGYSGRLLIAISVGWGLIQTGRLVLSPMLPTIIEELHITSATAGFSLTVLWALYALLQYPSGRLSDRLSRRTLLIGGLTLAVLGFSLFTVSETYPVFMVGIVILGLGAGLYPTAARALVSDLFVERRGQAYGLHTASGDLGGATAAGLSVVALAVASWQGAFPPIVVGLAAVAIALHVWGREPYRVERVDLEIGRTARRLLGSVRTRRLLVAYTLYAFVWQGATAFVPTFLQAEKAFSQGEASAAFAVLFLVGAVVKPTAGTLGDRTDSRRLAAASMGLGALALFGTIALDGVLVIGLALAVFAAGLMSVPPVLQAYLMNVFPDGTMGGDLGAMRTTYITLGSIGPTYVGVVAEYGNYRLAFLGLVTALVLSGSILLALSFGGD
ncbi:MAG: MFS family permease [Halobacteriales archaeon]